MNKSMEGAAKDYALEHDHVWKYFELHANHRMSMLNFFTVVSGLTIAGIGVALQAAERFSAVGIVLGVGLILLSFIFWKLDQRTAFLIKHAEAAQAVVESELPEALQLFSREDAATLAANSNRNLWTAVWTYGRSLRVTFTLIGLVGIAAVIVSVVRFSGLLDWDKATVQASKGRAHSVTKDAETKKQVAASSKTPAELNKTIARNPPQKDAP